MACVSFRSVLVISIATLIILCGEILIFLFTLFSSDKLVITNDVIADVFIFN